MPRVLVNENNVIRCRSCDRIIVKLDRRRTKTEGLVMVGDAEIERRKGQAARIRCVCGTIAIWLQGKL